jgi:GNAT superfamily N-acetyltransferase
VIVRPIAIHDARVADLQELNRLAYASKASWGYDDAFMAACREELTLRAADLDRTVIRVGMADDAIVGFASVACEGEAAELTALFVAPGAMRRGVGRTLLSDAVEVARAAGACRIRIEADPNAVGFYRAAGAQPRGDVPSQSIPGRRLPVLELVVP